MLIDNLFKINLEEIYNKIYNINNLYNANILSINKIKSYKFTNLDIISFASEKIKKQINGRIVNEYEVKYLSLKYIIITDKLYKIHYEIIKRLIILMLFFNDINIILKPNLKCYLFLENNKKMIPNPFKNKIILKSDYINSAQCLPTVYISVYRKEECLKTCIHEFIHFNKLDNYFRNIDININSNKKVLLQETISEVLSHIFDIMFVIIHNNENFNIFYHYLKKNIEFLYYQSSLFLKINNMELKELISGNKTFYEETNVIAYYIFKLAVFKNIYVFMNDYTKMKDIIIEFLNNNKNNIKIEYYKTKINKNKKSYNGRMTLQLEKTV